LDGAEAEQQSGYMVIPFVDYEIPYLAGAGMGIVYKPPDPSSRLTFGSDSMRPLRWG
jgi:hypothetical protein